ncbi:DUF5415 family protein [Acinetobacter baumannii]
MQHWKQNLLRKGQLNLKRQKDQTVPNYVTKRQRKSVYVSHVMIR